MEVTTAVSLNRKDRVLSPKRKTNFKGELLILNQGKPDAISNKRPLSSGKPAITRPSSGSLEVLRSDCALQTDGASLPSAEPSSMGQVKQLSQAEHRDRQNCCCSGENKLCDYCITIDQRFKELSVHGASLEGQDLKSRNYMAPRAAPSSQSFTPSGASRAGENVVAAAESESSSAEDESDDDDDDQQGGRDGDQGPSSGPASNSNKASLELLGMFLTALMKKDYGEARTLCDQILLVEPTNATCLEFRSTLKEKIQQDETENSDDSGEEDDEDDDGEDSDEDSEEDSAEENSEEEDNRTRDDSDDELANIDVNKLNLFVGGVPVNKRS